MTTIRRSRRAAHARRPDLKSVSRWRQATCSCGWVGLPRYTTSEAAADYRDHRDRR